MLETHSFEYIRFKNMFDKNKDYLELQNETKAFSKETFNLLVQIQAMNEVIPDFKNQSIEKVIQSVEGASDKIAAFFKKIWEGIKNAFKKLSDLFKKFVSWFVTLFRKKAEQIAKVTYEEIWAMKDDELKNYNVKCKHWKHLGDLYQNVSKYVNALTATASSMQIYCTNQKSFKYTSISETIVEFENQLYDNLAILGLVDSKNNNQGVINEILENGQNYDIQALHRVAQTLFYENGQIEEIVVSADQILTENNKNYLKMEISRNTKAIHDSINTCLKSIETIIKEMKEAERVGFEKFIADKKYQDPYIADYRDSSSVKQIDMSKRYEQIFPIHQELVKRYQYLLLIENILFNCTNIICKYITDQTSDLYEVSRQIIRQNRESN